MEGHASVAVVPLSPLHATQVSAPPHTGVVPVHAVEFACVHWTQSFVVRLQAGVGAVQFVSLAHGSHLSVFVPVVTHTPAMHSGVVVHPGSPSLMPHTFPFGSQTPVVQTSVAAAAVQVPLSVGFLCGGSPGIGEAFARVGVHFAVDSSHQFPVRQFASAVQPTSVLMGGPRSGSGSCVESIW